MNKISEWFIGQTTPVKFFIIFIIIGSLVAVTLFLSNIVRSQQGVDTVPTETTNPTETIAPSPEPTEEPDDGLMPNVNNSPESHYEVNFGTEYNAEQLGQLPDFLKAAAETECRIISGETDDQRRERLSAVFAPESTQMKTNRVSPFIQERTCIPQGVVLLGLNNTTGFIEGTVSLEGWEINITEMEKPVEERTSKNFFDSYTYSVTMINGQWFVI